MIQIAKKQDRTNESGHYDVVDMQRFASLHEYILSQRDLRRTFRGWFVLLEASIREFSNEFELELSNFFFILEKKVIRLHGASS